MMVHVQHIKKLPSKEIFTYCLNVPKLNIRFIILPPNLSLYCLSRTKTSRHKSWTQSIIFNLTSINSKTYPLNAFKWNTQMTFNFYLSLHQSLGFLIARILSVRNICIWWNLSEIQTGRIDELMQKFASIHECVIFVGYTPPRTARRISK